MSDWRQAPVHVPHQPVCRGPWGLGEAASSTPEPHRGDTPKGEHRNWPTTVPPSATWSHPKQKDLGGDLDSRGWGREALVPRPGGEAMAQGMPVEDWVGLRRSWDVSG